MASIAISAGMTVIGAVLNAAAFTGGNYLAKYLSGDGNAALEEKRRHDAALEAFYKAQERYRRERDALHDWIARQNRLKHQAAQEFHDTITPLSCTTEPTHNSTNKH